MTRSSVSASTNFSPSPSATLPSLSGRLFSSAHPAQTGAHSKGELLREVSMSKNLSDGQQASPQSSTGNPAEISCRQREMPLLQEVAKPVLLPESDIRLCTTFRDSLGLCIQRSRVRRTQNDLAGLAGIHATQFSKIIHGAKGQDWNLPGDAIEKIETACGNLAMTQYLASKHDGRIVLETPEQRRIRELEERLAKYEVAA